MKDEKILSLLKAGNYSKAGEKLYRYFPVVQKLVMKNHGTKREAEAIFQEAVMMTIKNLEGNEFVLKSRLNTHLYGVCRFLWNEALNKKNKGIEQADEQNQFLLKYADLENYQRTEADQRMAETAFKKLDNKCRQLLLLFYFDNKSLRDISMILSFSSEKTARNKKHRCIENAKENLRALKSAPHE
ncbi:MAG: sigma-70 family RNA polymerase sigma factor [Bacteroidota bacterium]